MTTNYTDDVPRYFADADPDDSLDCPCPECGEMTDDCDMKSFGGHLVCAWCFDDAGYYETGENGYDGD